MRVRDPRAAIVFLVCHACGTRIHAADHYCRRCGRAPLADIPEPAARRKPSRRLPRVRAAVAVAAVMLVIAAGVADMRPYPPHAEMAGIQVGDPPARVSAVLGKPARPPLKLLWRPDHNVEMWQYDLDRESGNVPNLSITFVDGRVWRIAALHGRYATRDGLHVGDTLDKAHRIYGTGIEEDAENGLVPWKFVCQGQVIKVIVEESSRELLAVGLETPQNLRVLLPPHGRPPAEGGEPRMPGDAAEL